MGKAVNTFITSVGGVDLGDAGDQNPRPSGSAGSASDTSPQVAVPPPDVVPRDSDVAATLSVLEDDNDTFYDALGEPAGEPPPPASHPEPVREGSAEPVPDATSIDVGDASVDAALAREDQTPSDSPQQTWRESRPESSGGAIVSNVLVRKGRTRVAASPRFVAATSGAQAQAQALAPSPPRKRGSASSVATLPTDVPTPAAPESNIPCKRAFLTGLNYTKSKYRLRYAVNDAIEFGDSLASELGFHNRDLVFAVDEGRPTCTLPSQGLGAGAKRNRNGNSNRNRLTPNECEWQRPVYYDNEKRFVHPTRKNILEGFRYLVRNVKEGAHLIWHNSGHCAYIDGKGPYLITANANLEHPRAEDMISKEDIRDELILKIPKGCRLDIFIDSCFGSALFNLQYCVGRMLAKEYSGGTRVTVDTSGPLSQHATSKLSQAQAPDVTLATTVPASTSEREHKNIQAPLFSSLAVTETAQPLGPVEEIPSPPPAPSMQIRDPVPITFPQDTSPGEPFTRTVSPATKVTKRSSGIASAPGPVPATPTTQTLADRILGFATASSATDIVAEPLSEPAGVIRRTNAQARYASQGVVKAPRPLDYFEGRKEGFDQPEGHVTVWVAAGGLQKAFEASKPVKHGILSNAVCKTLKACNRATIRELWVRIRDDIEAENEARSQRDLLKDEKDRPDAEARVQYAEIWASHPEPLDSSSSIMDREAFWYKPVVAAYQPEATSATSAQGSSKDHVHGCTALSTLDLR
ncbi:ICE-like protease (caspase) p20 domain protein [Ceratobasidium sp. AG-Ba]|nr:ICE-like protease (caspase) p20 domain protein [Ceratobasidium sp. AG-Ba]